VGRDYLDAAPVAARVRTVGWGERMEANVVVADYAILQQQQ
jgi:hypothetical protein